MTYLLLLLFLHIFHDIGENICAGLAKLGLDPRPKNRNIKWWWSKDISEDAWRMYLSKKGTFYYRDFRDAGWISYNDWKAKVLSGEIV